MEKPSPDVARKSSAEIRSEVEKIAVPYSLLEKITEDFSIERRVGQGGFATVYFASIYLAGNAAPRHLPDEMVVKVDKHVYYEGTSVDGRQLVDVKTAYMKKADEVS